MVIGDVTLDTTSSQSPLRSARASAIGTAFGASATAHYDNILIEEN